MNVLIACEESQRVCTEFRKLGFNAFSCDIESCSGGHPEWHIKGDVLGLLNGNCTFITQDTTFYEIKDRWDMIIAFPPCTYLSNVGTRHFSPKFNTPEKIKSREEKRQQGFEFFMSIANANCDKIAIENPVGYCSNNYRKPDQYIQPYYFGDPYRKKTCLWLKNLPNLEPTNIVDICDLRTYTQKNGKQKTFSDWYNKGGKDRQKNRSKTFKGIAKAMAEQWSV